MLDVSKRDRRTFERIPVSIPLTLINLDSDKVVEQARTCDISAKGVGILSRKYLSSGDRLELWLKMPDRREPFYTRGSVVWTRLQPTGEYRTGVSLERAEFMGMSRIFRS